MSSRLLDIKSLSPELRNEAILAKCEQRFRYFFTNYGVAEVRGVGIVPMREHVWKFQESFADVIQEEPRLVILKARQLGVSTELMHFAYWLCRFGAPKSQHVLVLSKSKEDAAYLLEKVPIINGAQPDFIRMDTIKDQIFSYQLANGNVIECMASTEGGGRSRAATAVILDEHAFHKYADKNWAALQPTLEGGGHFFVVSTGNGMGNLFYTLYQKAKAGDSKVGFKAVFIPYNAAPHRDEGWRENERASSPVSNELFTQEYPRSDSEAFAKTGSNPFDVEWVQTQLMAAQGMTIQKVLNDGRTAIFTHPRPHMLYGAGLDCAQGISADGRPDRTSLTIVDVHGNHVASWAGKEELAQASREIFDLLMMYRPLLVVERNSQGAGMIAALQALGWKKFYRFEKRHVQVDALPEKNPTYGVTMTPTIKGHLVALLGSYINSHSLHSNDAAFWNEVTTFVQKGPTTWGAQGGHYDDRVISMGWALWAISYMPRVAMKRGKKVRWR